MQLELKAYLDDVEDDKISQLELRGLQLPAGGISGEAAAYPSGLY